MILMIGNSGKGKPMRQWKDQIRSVISRSSGNGKNNRQNTGFWGQWKYSIL